MNWIWIILLLCCCKGNSDENCIQPRRESRDCRSRCREERCESGRDRDYPRPPFAPDYDRDRDRDRDHDCGCRASEMDKEDCEE